MSLATLSTKRQKLLDLYMRDKITADYFSEQEQELTLAIRAVKEQEQSPWSRISS